MSKIAERVSKRCRELRLAAELSQAEVAERAGLSVEAISRIERGARLPTIETAERIAQVLGVTLVQLVGEDEDVGRPTMSPRIARLVRLLEAHDDEVVDKVVRIARIVCER